jgi:hypothetical protein
MVLFIKTKSRNHAVCMDTIRMSWDVSIVDSQGYEIEHVRNATYRNSQNRDTILGSSRRG